MEIEQYVITSHGINHTCFETAIQLTFSYESLLDLTSPGRVIPKPDTPKFLLENSF